MTARYVKCGMTSGSITDCRPICAAPADFLAAYGGYGGRYTMPVCAGHVRALEGACHPQPVTLAPIGGAS